MATFPEDDRPLSWRSGISGQIKWRVRSLSEGDRPVSSRRFEFLFARGHALNEDIPPSGSDPGSGYAGLETLCLRHPPRQLATLLEGDLSFSLWDSESKRLILSTDRLGLHPIYYCCSGSELFVSWELEDLLQHHPDSRVDMTSLSARVAGFLLPEGRTCYDGIRRVPAGMIVTVDEGGFRLKRYWSLEEVPELRLPDDGAYVEALGECLSSVHRDWLRVLPVPMGITLSGGLDSTSVAAALRKIDSSRSIRAFSWVHPGLPEADESEGIGDACRALDLELTRIEADRYWTLSDPRGLWTSRRGPEAHYYRESWEATFQTATSQDYGYLLSGVGGDELFGGISSYPDLFLSGRWISLVRQLNRERKEPGFGPRYIFRSMLDPWLRNRFPAWERKRMRLPAWLTEATRQETHQLRLPPLPSRSGDFGRQVRIRFLQNLARNTQVLEVSRMAGCFGLKMIHPLLDRRLVEFAASLPSSQNSNAGKDKMILRKTFRETLPAAIIQRRRKITVESLFHRGFRERETEKVWPLLRGMRSAELGLVDEPSLQDHYRQYLEGGGSGHGIWNAIVVEDWLRRYF